MIKKTKIAAKKIILNWINQIIIVEIPASMLKIAAAFKFLFCQYLQQKKYIKPVNQITIVENQASVLKTNCAGYANIIVYNEETF